MVGNKKKNFFFYFQIVLHNRFKVCSTEMHVTVFFLTTKQYMEIVKAKPTVLG